jgi:adenine phosphoribosyltransferase
MHDLLSRIRSIPDFPKKGIVFRDITTLLKDADSLKLAVHELLRNYRDRGIKKVVGIESRGFILGGVIAHELQAGFVPVRKPGKLPAPAVREEYVLEYGTDAVEMHKDAIVQGERVLIHDDLLATGGTALAAIKLVEKLGGQIEGISFLIELSFLGGRATLGKHEVSSVLKYDKE